MNSFKSLVKAISPFTSSSKSKKKKHYDDDNSDDYYDGNGDDDDNYIDDGNDVKYRAQSKRRLHGKYKKSSSPTHNKSRGSSPNRKTSSPNHKTSAYRNTNAYRNAATSRGKYNNNNNDDDNKDNNNDDDIYVSYNWNIKGYRSSDIKYAVKLLYADYNPSKIDTIEFIYDQWKGEDILFLQNLCKRYRLKEKQMQTYLDDALLRDRRKSISSSSPAKSVLSSSPRFSKVGRESFATSKEHINSNAASHYVDVPTINQYQYQQAPSRVPPPPPPPPQQTIPQPSTSLASLFSPPSLPENLIKYANMLKHGVPEQAVILKMQMEQVSLNDQELVLKAKSEELSIVPVQPAPPTSVTFNDNNMTKIINGINEASKDNLKPIPVPPQSSLRQDTRRTSEQLRIDESDRHTPKVIEKEVIVEKILYRENEEKIQELKKELEEARKLYTSFEKLYKEESDKRHALEERKPKVIEKEVIVEKPIVVEKIIYVENEHKILALQHELEEIKRLYQEETDRRAMVSDEQINLLKSQLEETHKHMLEASKESKLVIELLMKHGAMAVNGALAINAKNKDSKNNDRINSVLELQMNDMKEELARTQADRAEILKLLEVIAFSPVDTKMVLDSYLSKYSQLTGILDPATYDRQLSSTFGSKELQDAHKRFYSPNYQQPKTPNINQNETQNISIVSISSPQNSTIDDMDNGKWNMANDINNENVDSSRNISPIKPHTLKEILIRDQYDLTKKYIQHGTIQAQASQKLVRNNIALEALEMNQVLTDISRKVKKDFDNSTTINDWVEHIDPKTRRKYYYSKSRGKSTWNLPLEYSLSKSTSKATTPTRFDRSVQSNRSSSPKLDSRSPSPRNASRSTSPNDSNSSFVHKYNQVDALPPPKKKWQSATDLTSGKTYYYCKDTNESTWRKPAGF